MLSRDEARTEVALAWRLLDVWGLTDAIFNHISVRCGDDEFAINPAGAYGRRLEPESVVFASLEGEVQGSGKANRDGLALHAAIQQLVTGSRVVVHLHSAASLAVGSSRRGLLPISQTAMEFTPRMKYMDYGGPFSTMQDIGKQIENLDLQESTAVVLLRNHGLLTVAPSTAEAVYLAYYVNVSCEHQLRMSSLGRDQLLIPADRIVEETAEDLERDRPELAKVFFSASLEAFGIGGAGV